MKDNVTNAGTLTRLTRLLISRPRFVKKIC